MSYLERFNHWNNEFKEWDNLKTRESSSGFGSNKFNTTNTINTLTYIKEKYNIKSLIDLPCGDMNWITTFLESNSDIKYTGFDISKELIERNTKLFNYNFMQKDIVLENLDLSADLILCRDFLFHLENENIIKIIQKFKNSGSIFLLTSSYINGDNFHTRIQCKGSRFFKIDLLNEPFNLPLPLEKFNEIEIDKKLYLWKLEIL